MTHCTDCGLHIRARDGDLILMGDHPYHIDCFDSLVDKAREDHARVNTSPPEHCPAHPRTGGE